MNLLEVSYTVAAFDDRARQWRNRKRQLQTVTFARNRATGWHVPSGVFGRNVVQHRHEIRVVGLRQFDEVVAAYDAGRCDVYTTDRSGLAAQRIKMKNPDEHVVLPEIISKEPLGPVVRHGDSKWGDIVRWTLYAMVEAEELGVTSKNVDKMKDSKNPNLRRLLGVEGDLGKNLGLPANWAFNIVKQVGNYGESYDANVGPKTSLKLERGTNALWKDGGLQYSMPVR